MNTVKGRFYTRFHDETIQQALEAHSTGYNSIEDAIADSSTFEKQEPYQILNDKLEVVKTIDQSYLDSLNK